MPEHNRATQPSRKLRPQRKRSPTNASRANQNSTFFVGRTGSYFPRHIRTYLAVNVLIERRFQVDKKVLNVKATLYTRCLIELMAQRGKLGRFLSLRVAGGRATFSLDPHS